eukprot:6197536-Pleurochrysis_carterae.AAC.5
MRLVAARSGRVPDIHRSAGLCFVLPQLPKTSTENVNCELRAALYGTRGLRAKLRSSVLAPCQVRNSEPQNVLALISRAQQRGNHGRVAARFEVGVDRHLHRATSRPQQCGASWVILPRVFFSCRSSIDEEDDNDENVGPARRAARFH